MKDRNKKNKHRNEEVQITKRKRESAKEEISSKAQINLTDADSRIMPVSGGSFEQSYNAQAGVDVDSHMIVSEHVTQACNDKQELEPTLSELNNLPPKLGKADKILCDAGYYSEENLKAVEEAEMTPYIPAGREKHNEQLEARINGAGPVPEEGAGAAERTAHRMKTEAGRREYGKRKGVSEPVFGIIKNVMGYRSFLTRGYKNVQKEWTLVCIAYNLKRLYNLFSATKGLMSPIFKTMLQIG